MVTGHKDKSGKFHPHTQYNGVRKSRDQKEKTEGTRLARHRFYPKGYEPPTFGKKKPEGKWEITKTHYGSAGSNEIDEERNRIYAQLNRTHAYDDMMNALEFERDQNPKLLLKSGEEQLMFVKTQARMRMAREMQFVTGSERKDALKHFWFDKLTPKEQKLVFEQFKKDRIAMGYEPFHGNIKDWREHELYMVSAFGDE